ncbi:unnamed protein product [Orchesella dallaii]|uniref:Homeobox domain-containing protein n=1 Tax=Orchesella dallaii TaxID=48710 RepID=A0ABP1PWI9_9HEXA
MASNYWAGDNVQRDSYQNFIHEGFLEIRTIPDIPEETKEAFANHFLELEKLVAQAKDGNKQNIISNTHNTDSSSIAPASASTEANTDGITSPHSPLPPVLSPQLPSTSASFSSSSSTKAIPNSNNNIIQAYWKTCLLTAIPLQLHLPAAASLCSICIKGFLSHLNNSEVIKFTPTQEKNTTPKFVVSPLDPSLAQTLTITNNRDSLLAELLQLPSSYTKPIHKRRYVPRMHFPKPTVLQLKEIFNKTPYPTKDEYINIEQQLNLPVVKIKCWFQNQRQLQHIRKQRVKHSNKQSNPAPQN